MQHIDRCIEVPSAQLGDSACTAGADSRTRSRRVLRAVIVAAVWALALVAIDSPPALAATPHTTYSSETDACTQCHVPHQAAGDNILRDLGGGTGEFDGVTFCYGCHDGTAAVNVKTGSSNASFAGTSGHALEAAACTGGSADLTDTCASCHYPHEDSTEWFRIPQRSIDVTLPDGVTVETRTVTGADNTWCYACHDDDQSWYRSRGTGVYPSLAAPTRNATGYPTLGTFPGATTYADPVANPHTAIPSGSMDDWVFASREATRVAGDCLWCHSGHRGVSEYDGLIDTFGGSSGTAADTVDGDYAAVCFRCHSATPASGMTFDTPSAAADIASSALTTVHNANDTNGHRIMTAGGDLPVGSPLPCYECHNPHGSTRGNATLFSDVLGSSLETGTDAGVRRFCFTCHTTADVDAGTGRPYGWDSEANSGAGGYVPVSASAEVAGLLRAAPKAEGDPDRNQLRLWDIRSGHDSDDTENCLTVCHGDVHAPMGSPAGQTSCFESACHSALHDMVDSTLSYHHVLNAADPDQAPGEDGLYPVFGETTQDLSCISCHVDHTEWEGLGNSYNLRSSGLDANPTASNTDEGLCLSCHSYTLPFRILRSVDGITPTPPGQADNALPATAVMRVEDDYWADSPHNYSATAYFADGSEFHGNCTKCHGTLEPGQYTETTPFSFTVHYSPEQRLLNALGQIRDASEAAINEEDMCFRCHSNSTDKIGASNYDYYGSQAMGAANRAIADQMDPANSPFGHKPADYYMKHLISSVDETQDYISANKHVECADCHNHHIVGKARHVYGTTNLVSDALKGVRGVGFGVDAAAVSTTLGTLLTQNYPATIDYAHDGGAGVELVYRQMAAYEYEVCFKCHSSANTDLAGWGGDMVWDSWTGSSWTVGTNAAVDNWTNVAQDFNVGNNSRHPVFATLDGYYYESEADYEYDLANGFSTDSKVRIPGYLDKLSDPATYQTSTLIADQVAYGWDPGDTMMCSDCHGDSTAPYAMVESPAGSGNWVTNPAAVTVPQGPHGATVRFSLRGPHTSWPEWGPGTGALEGTLITISSMQNFSGTSGGVFCTNCHPADKVRDNIVHRKGAHSNYPCIRCHILVPHGGKVSRLIGDAQTMPSRLAYQGNLSNMWVSGFNKRQNPSDYVLSDCLVSSSSSGCSGGANKHTMSNTATGMENW
ncbi:cytochrome c3 family protein [Anaerosoma tenue]|uniref:cytochrome c3 family protein n=1 Tax=Anaerosoma tenue TaxID=2933588 RepID=UPI002260F382|nr:cytochrome c3 family protein [Anaerosoma tenue]MCK8114672.1 hypothetical protein [Anaerosoma tenue]